MRWPEVIEIEKIKEKHPNTKDLKEKVKSVPKELIHRGLEDGTEHLRLQFRDAAQQGRQDGYGDRIEDYLQPIVYWHLTKKDLYL